MDIDWAVLLMAYGGPGSLDDIEPYLLDVRGGRETPQALVQAVRDRYARIGGRSPLLDITRAQAAALEKALNDPDRIGRNGNRYQVFTGMRHWAPFIREAVADIVETGFQRVVALCMAPHYSRMSVGAYAEKLRQAVEELQPVRLEVRMVESWHDHPLFIQSLAEMTQKGLQKFQPSAAESVHVLFSAHSLPAAIMQQGDPYADQLMETACRLAGGLGLPQERWTLCFQSAGAQNTRWLGPALDDVLETLAEKRWQNVLVAPIGFVADHVEILYDIDIEAREQAQRLGMRLERIESQNTSVTFIDALVDIVMKKTPESEK